MNNTGGKGSVACKKHLDRYHWDVIDTDNECVSWLVNKCNSSNAYRDKLFCKSSIDIRCKPCSTFMNDSIDKSHKCYNELIKMCNDEKHRASKFCLEHSLQNNDADDAADDDHDSLQSNHKESRWMSAVYALFCKCNYLDAVNVAVLRRSVFIVVVLFLSIFVTSYFS